jgi:hypothetical protein
MTTAHIVIGVYFVIVAVLAFLVFRGAKGDSVHAPVLDRSARVDPQEFGVIDLPGVPRMPENLVRMADRSARLRGAKFSTPAAKGFGRDAVVGSDQVTSEERQRWTNNVKPWGMN